NKTKNAKFITTDIIRWASNTRYNLFERLNYIASIQDKQPNLINIGADIEKSIFDKFAKHKPISEYLTKKMTTNKIYYRTAGGGYWVTILNTPFDSKSLSNKSSGFKKYYDAKVFSAILNSNLFWWYYCINFDLFNFKDYMIFNFLFNYPNDATSLTLMSNNMETSLQKNATYYTINSSTKGANKTVTYNKDTTKPIMDEIDTILAEHYGFTESELDFIINYDIKYRMGKSLFSSDSNSDDDEEE
ncbi:MAG: hypothetical protein JJT94_10630, partial [Bernardetiaceae bacterium]|nr:hypothetical protein [Bernardetiaceae bacterium]